MIARHGQQNHDTLARCEQKSGQTKEAFREAGISVPLNVTL